MKKYDLSSLRVLGSVGEPINPEAWQWYFDVVGKGKCTIVDTFWQTETGGIMITPMPGSLFAYSYRFPSSMLKMLNFRLHPHEARRGHHALFWHRAGSHRRQGRARRGQ